jgi:hypothetical protein
MLLAENRRVFTCESHPEYGKGINILFSKYDPDLSDEQLLEKAREEPPVDHLELREIVKAFVGFGQS